MAVATGCSLHGHLTLASHLIVTKSICERRPVVPRAEADTAAPAATLSVARDNKLA